MSKKKSSKKATDKSVESTENLESTENPETVEEDSIQEPKEVEPPKEEKPEPEKVKSKTEEFISVGEFLIEKKIQKHRMIGFMAHFRIMRTTKFKESQLKTMWEEYSKQLIN